MVDAEKEQAWQDFLNHDCMQELGCVICLDFGAKCLRTGYTKGKTTPFVYSGSVDSRSP